MEKNLIQIKSGIMINVNMNIEHNICEKDSIWNPATCSCEMKIIYKVLPTIRWLHVKKLKKKENKIPAKPLRISFNKIDGFIRVYDRTRYLVLLGGKRYDYICNKIRYFMSVKWYYICNFS